MSSDIDPDNQEALEKVLYENPTLSAAGFRVVRSWPSVAARAEAVADFQQDREDLRTGRNRIDFDRALRFLSGAVRIQSFPVRGPSSYGLKHTAELIERPYICNGALIAAALALGIKVKRFENSPNAQFAISMKWIREQKERARLTR